MISADVLLERDEPLARLGEALQRARAGRGELLLVTGEAGAGKTSLVRRFAELADDQGAGDCVVLWGSADPVSTPRPLGPLIDAASQIDHRIAERLTAGVALVDAFAMALQLVDGTTSGARPTVVVLEDMHWADEATLDVLTFVARRIERLRALLVVTFRDDEVRSDHPLRLRLGDLQGAIRSRVHVESLSREAVASLVEDTEFDATDLYEATGGNAFFTTEALAAGRGVVPRSVSEAVLARASRLSPVERAVLDAISIVPGRADVGLIEAIMDDERTRGAIDGCIERGLLTPTDPAGGNPHGGSTDDAVTFRHEIARRAIEDAVPLATRRTAHERALRFLRSRPGTPSVALLAYHAAEAGDAEAIAAFAPAAAREAAAVGNHREAARHLDNALRLGAGFDGAARGDLLMQLAGERALLSDGDGAVAAYDEAADLFSLIDDVGSRATAIVRSARPLVVMGRQPEGEARVALAASLVEGRPPSVASAWIATMQATNHMLAREFDAAEVVGRRAMEASRAIGADDVLAEVSIQSGIALAMSGDDAGLDRIRAGMELAGRLGLDTLVALGYSQIGSGYGELRRYDVAVPALRDGITFCSDRELVSSAGYMQAWLARCELEVGNWDAAAEHAGRVLRNPRCVGIARFVALVTLGWIRGRRGDPDVDVVLDEAVDLARRTGHLQRLWPVAACRGELAWLAADPAPPVELLAEASELARSLDYRPAIEELDHWQTLLDGVARGTRADATTPFGATAAGEPGAAARGWAAIGCPYEEAVARLLTNEPADMLTALEIAGALGADPLRDRITAALRRARIAIPRGPIGSTRSNAFGLTERELDVLAELATGRTNRDIAGRLGISTKTVDHHVSSVLTKLGARSRAEAAVAAERIGLTPPIA